MLNGKDELWRAKNVALLLLPGVLGLLVSGRLLDPFWRHSVSQAEASEAPLAASQEAEGWEVELRTEGSGEAHSVEAQGHVHAEGEAEPEADAVEVPADLLEPLGIVTQPVQQGDLAASLELYGWVLPRPGDVTDLHSPIAGTVHEIHAHPGDWIESGSPLVTLRVPAALEWQKTILEALDERSRLASLHDLLEDEGHTKVIQLLGDLRVAAAEKSRLEEEMALLDQASGGAVPRREIGAKRGELRSAIALLEAKRALALAYRIESGVMAQIEQGASPIQVPEGALPPEIRRQVNEISYRVHDASHNYQVAWQSLSAAGFTRSLLAKLGKDAEGGLEDLLTLRAERPGLVEQSFISRRSAAGVADPLLRIIDYRKVHVEAEIPEIDIPRVLERASDEMPVRVTGLDGRVVTGRTVYFDTTVHPDVRKAHLVLEVDNVEGKLLRDHMAVSVGVPLSIRQGTLSVPKESVLTDGFEKVVFLDEGGVHFHRTAVKTGVESLDSIEIVEGLSAGDQVVVKGARTLLLALRIPKGGDPHAGHSHAH